MSIEQNIREISRKLLSDGVVDLIIGYGQGTLPYATTPVFIRNADDVEQLIWNPCCTNNLALYVRRELEQANKKKDARPLKIGVVTKKCDAKAMVELIRENQLKRESIVVIAVPCSGMLDKAKLHKRAGDRELLRVEVSGSEVILAGRGFEIKVNRDEVLRDNCLVCKDPESLPIADEIVVEKDDYKKPYVEDDFSDVKEHEKLSPQERWAVFRAEFENCIRCYACRNACPMCYCSECFAECSQPRWLGGSVELKDVLFFQIVRVLHQAGRCVDCGACAAACPMDLDIRKYTRKLNYDALNIFRFETGVSPDDKPLLATFSIDDTQEFITEPE
ncbi:4Fe-4S ferredoxin [Candidatus Sumerlaeota bacterium]|nr:4Fe-4S ferredoxin [Candidatus Sumerlaeota bacterium]